MVEIIEEIPTGTPPPPDARQSENQPRALAKILATQLEALEIYHRAVLEIEDPDAIHKMRVTTRRTQATLDLLEGELPVRKLKKTLRRWRRMLSRVRNYDVFLMLIDKEVGRSRPAYRKQFELLKAILQKRRERKAIKVKKFLARVKVSDISKKLGIATPNQPGESANLTATESGSQKIASLDDQKIAERAFSRLQQRVAEFYALASQSHPAARAEDLHQLRIAAKRVRYLLETISQMGYGDASSAISWLRGIQDRIGDWHDLESLEEEIIEIILRHGFLKKHIAESSRMLQAAAHLQKKKEALVSKLFPIRVPKSIAATSQKMERGLRAIPFAAKAAPAKSIQASSSDFANPQAPE